MSFTALSLFLALAVTAAPEMLTCVPRWAWFGKKAFTAWLNEPAPVGGEHGVTRYLYEIYSSRPDLRQTFPNLDGPDAIRLIEWHRIYLSAPRRVPALTAFLLPVVMLSGGWHLHLTMLQHVLEGTKPPRFWDTHAKLEAKYAEIIP